MAISTSRPSSKGLTRFAPAPSYSGVVSRFASEIQAALQQQEEAEIQQKVLDYRNGITTFADLQIFLKDKSLAYATNSLKKVKVNELLADVTKEETANVKRRERAKLESKASVKGVTAEEKLKIEQELLNLEIPGTVEYQAQQKRVIDSTDNAEVEKVERLKTELLDRYKEGGITSEEELAIYRELRNVANPDSEISRKLAVKEAEIMTTIQQEKEAKAKAGAGAANTANVQKATQIYERNIIENQNIMDKYQSNPILYPGLKAEQAMLVNWKEIEQALQGIKGQVEGKTLGTIQAQVQQLEQSVKERLAGDRFDVLDNSNKVRSATMDEIRNDTKGEFSSFRPRYNSKKDQYEVVDPQTGKTVFAGDEGKAKDYAKQVGIGGITVLNEAGPKEYFANKQTGEYFRRDDKGIIESFAKIPGTPELEQMFKSTIAPQSTKADVFKGFLSGVEEKAQQFIGEPLRQGANMAATAIGNLGRKVGRVVERVGQVKAQLPSAISNIQKAIPDFQLPTLPKIQLPQFKLPDFSFNAPRSVPAVQKAETSNLGLLGNIKKLGSEAVKKTSSFLGGLFRRK